MSKKYIAKALTTKNDDDWLRLLKDGLITLVELDEYKANRKFSLKVFEECIDDGLIPTDLVYNYNIIELTDDLSNAQKHGNFLDSQLQFANFLIKHTDVGEDEFKLLILKKWMVAQTDLIEVYRDEDIIFDFFKFELGAKLDLIDWGYVSKLKMLSETYCSKYLTKLNWEDILVYNLVIPTTFVIEHQDDILNARGGERIDFVNMYTLKEDVTPRLYKLEDIKKLGHLFKPIKYTTDYLARYYSDSFIKNLINLEEFTTYTITLPKGLNKEDINLIKKYAQHLDEQKSRGIKPKKDWF